MVDNIIGPVANRIIMDHTWDFAVDTATENTVVGQASYTLEGNDADCRDIVNIRIGDGDGRVIEEFDRLELDRRLSTDDPNTNTNIPIDSYAKWGRSSDDFPIVQLYGTPQTVETLTYRFHKKDLSLQDIPGDFGYIVIDAVKAEFDASLRGIAENSLNEMKARHTPGGDSFVRVRLDPTIEKGNRERNNMYGGA